jgi:hypothetical protein
MGHTNFVWHGLYPKAELRPKNTKRQKLCVSVQPCKHDRHHDDVVLIKKSFCICWKKRTSQTPNFWFFL